MPPGPAPRVQFATTTDGVRIAFWAHGQGPPLFWLPHYLVSHVQLEWEFPQRYIYERLSRRFTVVRFDARGLGLSDRDPVDLSLEARARDVTAVAERLGYRHFSISGIQGGGNLASYYAALHPERVSRLALINWSPFFKDEAWEGRRGSLGVLLFADWDLLVENVGGTSFGFQSPYAAGYGRLIKATLTQEMAIRYANQFLEEDVRELLPSIAAETMVAFSTENPYASLEGARSTAAVIPNASFAQFEGGIADHIQDMVGALRDFFSPVAAQAGESRLPVALTSRETEILVLLANGLSNRLIAEQLVLSARTVERHLENLYRKIDVHNRAEATAYAFRQGLAGPGS